MKKIEWATPNRMKFESLHKTFNRQTQVIATGNILSNTLSGSYVRAYNETECNGYTNAPGHLQAFDLRQFGNDLPHGAREFINDHGKDEKLLVYVLRHWAGGIGTGRKIVDGCIITSTDHKLLRAYYGNNGRKVESIISEALKYLAE